MATTKSMERALAKMREADREAKKAGGWIVVWIHPADTTGKPYWRGVDDHDESHVFVSDARHAHVFPTKKAALDHEPLSDFWDSGDVEARQVAAPGPAAGGSR